MKWKRFIICKKEKEKKRVEEKMPSGNVHVCDGGDGRDRAK